MRAATHHKSHSTTWLQHVRFKPVLPALNEMRMTDVAGSERSASRFASRCSGFIEPS